MRIGIDGRIFIFEKLTGISLSVYKILEVWAKQPMNHEFYILSHKPVFLNIDFPDNWHIIVEPEMVNKGLIWSITKLPKIISKLNLDIFWGTSYTLPKKINGVKYFITIYDLAIFKFKDIGTAANSIRLKIFTKRSCYRADGIIAISKGTARDVHEIFGIEHRKIRVSYCGGLTNNVAEKEYDLSKVRDSLIFNEPFILFISTIEPRKNVSTIVKAFDHYKKETKNNIKLVLAGGLGWKYKGILRTIDESINKADIILPGYISNDEKIYLLKHASAFVYPSLYEGFGIPILEAMAFNIPVITTNVSSMPEVGGKASFYIENPLDKIELSDQIKKVLSINAEQMSKLKLLQRDQLNKFSWEKNAKEVMDYFED